MEDDFNLDKILKLLNISVSARRVYIEILQSGEVTPSSIARSLSMARPSVYDQLKILKDKALIVEKEIDSKTYYLVNDVKDIIGMLDKNIKTNQEALTNFKKLLPTITKKEEVSPKIKFFYSKESIQRCISNFLYAKNRQVYSLWPYSEMLDIFNKELLEDINSERVSKNIKLKVIWPSKASSLKTHIWSNADTDLIRKYAPSGSDFKMGYIIYDDKVVFVSSKTESYAFVIESREFANLQLMQFNNLWEASRARPIK